LLDYFWDFFFTAEKLETDPGDEKFLKRRNVCSSYYSVPDLFVFWRLRMKVPPDHRAPEAPEGAAAFREKRGFPALLDSRDSWDRREIVAVLDSQ